MPQSNDAGVRADQAANDAPVNEASNAESPVETGSQVQEQRTEDRGQPSTGPEQPISTETTGEDLAEHFNLPAGIRAELDRVKTGDVASSRDKSASASVKATADSSSPADGTGEEAAGTAAATEEAEGDESASAEATADSSRREASGEKRPPKAPKHWPPEVQREFEKRVGKIWKQKSTAEERADQAEQLAGDFQTQLNQFQTAQAEAAQAAPLSAGILGKAQNERQLDQLTSEAEAIVDLVDQNPEGMTTGEGDKTKFYGPEDLARWKRDAEKILRGAEGRRRQIREFTGARQHYDAAAKQEFPKLFDRTTPEFQTAVAIAQRYPWIRGIPEANYALGVMVEGFRALEARRGSASAPLSGATADSSNGEHPEDLDGRLDPQYQREHIPPMVRTNMPNRPSRNNGGPAAANTFENLTKTAERFIRKREGDGASVAQMDATDLAEVLKNLPDEAEASNKPKLVKV